MNIILGVLFLIWGLIILAIGAKKMSDKDLKAESRGDNILFEIEWLTLLIQKLPSPLVRSFVIIVGVAFSGTGVFLIV
ncbi:hypothetical protein EPH95_16310 [Salicibibacter halophilus]|uniref:Uncharacterized protein n=1 Tax=Salicibibacter halophilus TaxID=2502791 RepID=A0A514LL18_9BACI|nr:hypothetical protein [Salicibibacter halophilus]QDI92549.1 hypothetical protein EPH95_16310 [Salicibibacter halophilus]